MTTETTTLKPGQQLLTIAEVSRRYGLPIRTLRAMLFERHTNGLSSAILRLNRHLRVDEAAFLRWLESKRETPSRGATA